MSREWQPTNRVAYGWTLDSSKTHGFGTVFRGPSYRAESAPYGRARASDFGTLRIWPRSSPVQSGNPNPHLMRDRPPGGTRGAQSSNPGRISTGRWPPQPLPLGFGVPMSSLHASASLRATVMRLHPGWATDPLRR